jgi:hypothetical protein
MLCCNQIGYTVVSPTKLESTIMEKTIDYFVLCATAGACALFAFKLYLIA